MSEEKNIQSGNMMKDDIPEKEPMRNIKINVSSDKLEAILDIEYEDGFKYEPRDVGNQNRILTKVKCSRYTVDEVKNKIKSRGIVFGIDEPALLKVAEEGGSAVVAKGTKYIDGSDDEIELKFKQSRDLEEINGKVDYFSIGKVVSVDANELIAVRKCGSSGKAGMDVFGRAIKPPAVKQIKLKAGRGVRISDDGLRAYSNILGRPEYKNGTLSVFEVYEVHGNVDITTGNIEFTGDIIISGNVVEGMKITAGNNVMVYGGASGAEITAGGDVTIYNNVIRSRIKAGCRDVLLIKLKNIFDDMDKVIEGIFSAVKSLKETGKIPITIKDGEIIKGLLDTKYKTSINIINELRSLLQTSKDTIDMETLQTGAKLIKLFTGKGPLAMEDYNELLDIGSGLKERITALEEQQREPSNVSVTYIQNSEVSTSGSIKVNGKGCYNSELFCKGDVEFSGKGFMRGGSLTAGGNVKLHELGSGGSAYTIVKTGKESWILADIAHPNSEIDIGGMHCRIDIPSSNVKAYIYKGELMIEKSRM